MKLWLGDCSKFMLFNFSGLCPECPTFYGNWAACHKILVQFVQAFTFFTPLQSLELEICVLNGNFR